MSIIGWSGCGCGPAKVPRAQLSLPVRLVATEATFSVASGQTVDVGVGLRALVDGLPVRGVEPTVRIDLSGDRALLCDAWWRRRQVDDGWEYRLAFRNLD